MGNESIGPIQDEPDAAPAGLAFFLRLGSTKNPLLTELLPRSRTTTRSGSSAMKCQQETTEATERSFPRCLAACLKKSPLSPFPPVKNQVGSLASRCWENPPWPPCRPTSSRDWPPPTPSGRPLCRITPATPSQAPSGAASGRMGNESIGPIQDEPDAAPAGLAFFLRLGSTKNPLLTELLPRSRTTRRSGSSAKKCQQEATEETESSIPRCLVACLKKSPLSPFPPVRNWARTLASRCWENPPWPPGRPTSTRDSPHPVPGRQAANLNGRDAGIAAAPGSPHRTASLNQASDGRLKRLPSPRLPARPPGKDRLPDR